MRTRFIYILLLSFSVALGEEKIVNVKFIGADGFSEKKLSETSGLKKGTNFSEDVLEKASENIRTYLERNGALLARVDSVVKRVLTDTLSVELIFFISNCKPIKIKNLRYRIVDNEPSQFPVNQWGKKFLGKIFDEQTQKTILHHPIEILQESGYPFAKVWLSDFALDTNSISVEISVSTGNKVELNGLKMDKPDNLVENLIKKKVRTKFPIDYSKRKIREMENLVARLEFIELQGTPKLVADSYGKWWLLVSPRRKKSNVFTGSIAFVPSTKTGKRFSGNINFVSKNIVNTGRGLELNYITIQQARDFFSIIYKDPVFWIFESRIRLGFEKRTNAYSRDEFEISLEYPLKSTITFAGSYAYIKTKPDSFGLFFSHIPETEEQTIGSGVRYSKKEGFSGEKDGWFAFGMEFAYSFVRRKTPEFIQNMLKSSYKFKVNSRLEYARRIMSPILFLSVSHSKITTNEKNIPTHELLFLGGTKTLRGYNEENFAGKEILFYRTELRYTITKDEWLFLFNDGGTYRRDDNWSGIKFGAGAGIRLNTKIGRLELAYGMHSIFKPTDGTLHIILLTEF